MWYMNFQCPSCGNPSRDGGLCDHDTGRLTTVLSEAPGLLADLVDTISRQTVMHSQIRKVRSSEPPLPVNLKASDLASGFGALLVSWARACGGDDDPALTGGGEEAATWLLARVHEVRVHEACAEVVDELTWQAKACWRVIDLPRDLVPLGQCGAVIDRQGQPCACACHAGSDAYRPECDLAGGCGSVGCRDGWLATDGARCVRRLTVEPGQATVTCRACGATHDVRHRQREALADASHMHAQPSQIAGVMSALGFHCTPSMIRGYAGRKRIKATHTDDSGRTWYRIGDVHDAWLKAHDESEQRAEAS